MFAFCIKIVDFEYDLIQGWALGGPLVEVLTIAFLHICYNLPSISETVEMKSVASIKAGSTNSHQLVLCAPFPLLTIDTFVNFILNQLLGI